MALMVPAAAQNVISTQFRFISFCFLAAPARYAGRYSDMEMGVRYPISPRDRSATPWIYGNSIIAIWSQRLTGEAILEGRKQFALRQRGE
ncbi:hypothetical protein [Acidovorax sp. 107]|uniref:hypothetical protein n=1 Tax=Acidovorax sp. 107 TaxID=2135638 RepID=UPI000D360EEB|nr:hypothetical protein [Acidovorax sp. 107]